MMWYYFVLFGALGGFIRALLGLRKAMTQPKFQMNLFELITTIILGACVGGIVSVIPNMTPYLAIGAGYAGDDAIKGFFPKPAGPARKGR